MNQEVLSSLLLHLSDPGITSTAAHPRIANISKVARFSKDYRSNLEIAGKSVGWIKSVEVSYHVSFSKHTCKL